MSASKDVRVKGEMNSVHTNLILAERLESGNREGSAAWLE